MRTERVEFDGAFGDRLAARLERPAGPARAYAIFAHCFSCSKDVHAAARVSRRLAEAGFAVLRFDFTGLGGSEGDFANTNFSSNVADIVKAAEFLAAEHEAPGLLVGHSLGGAAVLAAAAKLPDVKAVATLNAPSDAAHVTRQFAANLDDIRETGSARVMLAGRPFQIRRQFLEDLDGRALLETVAALRRPLLIAHAPLDEVVGVSEAGRLFEAALHPKSFLSLDGADHLLSAPEDSQFAADVIAAWAARYVAADREADPETPEHGVVARETGLGKFHTRIYDGPHRLVADEPEAMGGDAGGPSPYGLLSAALGACTSMTLRMYADHKGIPLDRVTVSVSHEKAHAEDCAACADGADRKVDVFEREIRLEGEITEADAARLMEIADKCPVHRTLHEPVVIRTRRAP